MNKQPQFGAASLLVLMAIGVTNVLAAPPDFTKGDMVPEGANHDWTLGATGARGWIFSDKLVTTDANQRPVGARQRPISRSCHSSCAGRLEHLTPIT